MLPYQLSDNTSKSITSSRRKLFEQPPTQNVIGFNICSLSLEAQLSKMLQWADQRLSKVVCVANVHMIMEGNWHSDFSDVLNQADLLTPDGMPLAWMMSWLQLKKQERVAGMDIFVGLCKQADERPVSLFLVGSTPETLGKIQQRLSDEFPGVQVAGMVPLPFRPLTVSEDKALVQQINDSKAGLVFVCLGCPKQEQWMHAHKGQIDAVMIGLGGAFSMFAGEVKRAPKFARELGLEWLYRLFQEPRRLWKRYFSTIPPFLFLAFRQAVSKTL